MNTRIFVKLLLSVCILYSNLVIPQNGADLKLAVRSSSEPEKKLRNLQQLVKFYLNTDKDSARKYFQLSKNVFSQCKILNDTANACQYLNTALILQYENPDSALTYAKKASVLYKKLDIGSELTEVNFIIEGALMGFGQYEAVMRYAKESILISQRIHNQKNECEHIIVLAGAYDQLGNKAEALDCFEKGLKLAKKLKYYKLEIQALISLSFFYNDIDISKAKKYLSHAKNILPLINEKSFEQKYYSALGNTYSYDSNSDSAIYAYNKALSLMDSTVDITAYASAVGNIGDVLTDMGEYKESIIKHQKSLKYFISLKDTLDLSIAYGSIGDNYLKLKDNKQAITYYKLANAMAHAINAQEQLIYNYGGIASCYENIGDYKNAYSNFKLFKQLNDSLNSAGNAKKLTEKELQFQYEIKQKEQELQQKNKDEITQEQIKRQRIVIFSGILGAIGLVVFLLITLRNSNIRKKINKQLELSHAEIEGQKNIIETKNREITDSITYAARLQQGILPDIDDVKKLLPGSFIFYRPRDIVSGDFYWIRQLEGNSKIGTGRSVAVAIADCTGHGVPGAFMSFIGSTILNQTLGNTKVQSPADALKYLNEQLPLTLQSKQKTGQINDGMEAGICVIDKLNSKLFFAGANLNLIHIRNNTITEIKGDKHSIGLNIEQQKNFTNHEIKLEKNDCVFLFSDGYPDQFGGPKGKKFKYKNLVTLLNANSTMLPEEQLEKLTANFYSWKKDVEQLDDVLLFGFKV